MDVPEKKTYDLTKPTERFRALLDGRTLVLNGHECLVVGDEIRYRQEGGTGESLARFSIAYLNNRYKKVSLKPEKRWVDCSFGEAMFALEKGEPIRSRNPIGPENAWAQGGWIEGSLSRMAARVWQREIEE